MKTFYLEIISKIFIGSPLLAVDHFIEYGLPVIAVFWVLGWMGVF